MDQVKNKSIDVSKQAIIYCSIIKIPPTAKLSAIHPRRIIDILQENFEHCQDQDPEQPRLNKAYQTSQQRIPSAHERNLFHNPTQECRDNMDNQDRSQKQD